MELKRFQIEPVANLILFVPTIYSIGAYRIPFNRGFTEVIRQPLSWADSDAWELLGMFTGNLLLIEAEKDDMDRQMPDNRAPNPSSK